MRFAAISNKEISVCQWPDGAELYTFTPQQTDSCPINTISWSKNGVWLVHVQRSRMPQIISLGDEANLLYSINSMTNATCASFPNATKRNIAIGTLQGEIVIYDVKEKCVKRQLKPHTKPVHFVQYTVNDSHLLGLYEDENVYVYKNTSFKQLNSLAPPKGKTISNFKCHQIKANVVGIGCAEGTVAAYDLNMGKPTSYNDSHKARVIGLAFNYDQLITIGHDRRLCLADYRTGLLSNSIVLSRTPNAIDVAIDGNGLAIGYTDGHVIAYDMRSLKEEICVLHKFNSCVNQIVFDRFSSAEQKGKGDASVSEYICAENLPKEAPVASFSDVYCDKFNSQLSLQLEASSLHTANYSLNKHGANTSDSFINLLHNKKEKGSRNNIQTESNLCQFANSIDDCVSPIVQVYRPTFAAQQNDYESKHSTPIANSTKEFAPPVSESKPSEVETLADKPVEEEVISGISEEDIRKIIRQEMSRFEMERYKQMSSHLWAMLKKFIEVQEQLDNIQTQLAGNSLLSDP